MIRSLLPLLALCLSFSVIAAPAEEPRLMVLTTVDGASTAANNKVFMFYPSEVVDVMDKQEDMVLVHGRADALPTWLPATALADTSSFTPVKGWRNQAEFGLASLDGERRQRYYFKPDGSFRATADGKNGRRKWTGKLHRNGRFIWAKPKQGAATFANWSVFKQSSTGRLCMLEFEPGVGCKCITSDKATYPESCKETGR